MLNKFKNYWKIKAWRKKNSNNFTYPGHFFSADCVSAGNYTYGQINVYSFNKGYRLEIGSFCSIAPNVSFLLCSDHEYTHVTTYPVKTKLLRIGDEAVSKGNIIIKDDVWIGEGATILSGVTVGQGSVIGAGSYITHNVEPYSIVAGNPAKLIKYRFSDVVIKELLRLDYSKISKELLSQLVDDLYTQVDDNNCRQVVDKIIGAYSEDADYGKTKNH